MCGKNHTHDSSGYHWNSHTCLVFTTHMEVLEIIGNSHTCEVPELRDGIALFRFLILDSRLKSRFMINLFCKCLSSYFWQNVIFLFYMQLQEGVGINYWIYQLRWWKVSVQFKFWWCKICYKISIRGAKKKLFSIIHVVVPTHVWVFPHMCGKIHTQYRNHLCGFYHTCVVFDTHMWK